MTEASWVTEITVVLMAMTLIVQVVFFLVETCRSNRAAAVRSLGEAIKDLTTHPVATSRKEMTDWVSQFRKSPRSRRRTKKGRGGDLFVGRHANAEVRHHVFVLLWALHRLAPSPKTSIEPSKVSAMCL